MIVDMLSNMGFNVVPMKEKQIEGECVELDLAVVKPLDHSKHQLVLKLPRFMLDKMDVDIGDKIKFLSHPIHSKLAIVKAGKNDDNSFVISSQGSTVELAKQRKRGGSVKISWREQFGLEPDVKGSHTAQAEIIKNAVIFEIPHTMYS